MAEWLERYHGWLDRFVRNQKRRERIGPEKKEAEIPKAVIYPKLFCQNCGSDQVPVYKTDLPLRYHKCAGCGLNFKSVDPGGPPGSEKGMKKNGKKKRGRKK